MAVRGVLAILDDLEGGNQPFAVQSKSVRDAQIAVGANLRTMVVLQDVFGP
jgi:hypothetical protein